MIVTLRRNQDVLIDGEYVGKWHEHYIDSLDGHSRSYFARLELLNGREPDTGICGWSYLRLEIANLYERLGP